MIIPYVEMVKERDDLPLRQHALCIFDVFAAHRGAYLIDYLNRRNINTVFVPGNCTSELQPLDVNPSPNQIFKDAIRAEFTKWYSGKVCDAVKKGLPVEEIEIDLRLSHIKPLHAKWLVTGFKSLQDSKGKILSAWETSGILPAVRKCLEK